MAKIKFLAEPWPKRHCRNIQIRGLRQSGNHRLAVARGVAILTGFQQSRHQGHVFPIPFLRKIPPYHEHLFGVARCEFRARGHTPASARLHRDRVPRLAYTKAIQIAGLQIRHHLRRRYHHNAHITFRLDARRCQPVPHQKIVG